jgi:adhesin/invasin
MGENCVTSRPFAASFNPMPLFRSTAAFTRLQNVSRGVALIASAGAAVVSLGAALYTYGIIGHSASHKTIGNIGAAWVRLKPTLDSATAIGDTVHFAATVADKTGSILVGATPVWTTADSSVAVARPDGSIIARGPGTTTITVVAGDVVGSAQVVVKQQVAGVAIVNPAGDTAAVVNEGEQLQLRAHALDARGHAITGRVASWRMDDTSVASVDSHGMVAAKLTGHAIVAVSVDGSSAFLPLTVAAPATGLALLAGASQEGPAGRILPQRIVVRATNRRGVAASGKVVTFRLRGGLGKAEPQTATTDADGRARTQWTLGDTPGAQRLFATVDNLDSATVVDAVADPVAKNTRVTPLTVALQGHAGSIIADSAGVRVTDSTGRALAGVVVKFAAVDGSIAGTDARTDSTGIARAKWTLGNRVGSQRLRAFVGPAESRIAPATIVAHAIPGVPSSLTVVSGDRQRGSVTKPLAKPIVVRVSDAGANLIAGAQIAVSASAGTVEDSIATTDSSGVARIQWTMPRTSGDISLTARIEGVRAPARISAYALAAAPANLSFEEARQAKSASRARKVAATVTDLYGNPVSDALVVFSSEAASISPARALTDGSGRVELTVTGARDGQAIKGVVKGTDVVATFVVGRL